MPGCPDWPIATPAVMFNPVKVSVPPFTMKSRIELMPLKYTVLPFASMSTVAFAPTVMGVVNSTVPAPSSLHSAVYSTGLPLA